MEIDLLKALESSNFENEVLFISKIFNMEYYYVEYNVT